MTWFITKFNQDLSVGVAATREKLENLKKAADVKTDQAQHVLHEYLETLDEKIFAQSLKLETIDGEFEDMVFNVLDKGQERKDERTQEKLVERAHHALKRSERAFSKSLHAIDNAEREMLRSQIAHADAGIPNPEHQKIVLK